MPIATKVATRTVKRKAKNEARKATGIDTKGKKGKKKKRLGR